FRDDGAFIARIEAAVPPGSMIMQMPWVPFPEFQPVEHLGNYSLALGYLHSRRLRWSYGAVKGRAEARWLDGDKGFTPAPGPFPESQPVYEDLSQKAVDTIAAAGFAGIYLALDGFPDDGVAIVKKLESILGEEPMRNRDGRLAFFNLENYRAEL